MGAKRQRSSSHLLDPCCMPRAHAPCRSAAQQASAVMVRCIAVALAALLAAASLAGARPLSNPGRRLAQRSTTVNIEWDLVYGALSAGPAAACRCLLCHAARPKPPATRLLARPPLPPLRCASTRWQPGSTSLPALLQCPTPAWMPAAATC